MHETWPWGRPAVTKAESAVSTSGCLDVHATRTCKHGPLHMPARDEPPLHLRTSCTSLSHLARNAYLSGRTYNISPCTAQDMQLRFVTTMCPISSCNHAGCTCMEVWRQPKVRLQVFREIARHVPPQFYFTGRSTPSSIHACMYLPCMD